MSAKVLGRQAPREVRDGPYDVVIFDDLRSRADDGRCFWCGSNLGSRHVDGCVIPRTAGSFLVAIRCNTTGEIRMYREDLAWDDVQSDWEWTEGNSACDCNRSMYFQRAGGEDPIWDSPCGDNRYSALYALLPDGTKKIIDQGATQ